MSSHNTPLRIVALLFALLLSVASPAAANGSVEFLIESIDSSAIGGSAMISEPLDGRAQLSVALDGLSSESAYQARLHAGTCQTPSASFGTLGTMAVAADGRGHVQTEQMEAMGGRTMNLTLDLLADGDHVVVIVDLAANTAVACGPIPPAEGRENQRP